MERVLKRALNPLSRPPSTHTTPTTPGGVGPDDVRAGSAGLICRGSGLAPEDALAGDVERGKGNAGFFSALGFRCIGIDDDQERQVEPYFAVCKYGGLYFCMNNKQIDV